MVTDTLVTQVRNLAQVPDTDEDITEEFILTQAYLGLLERFTQPLVMMRNGTWLHSYTFETTAGVSRYRLPPRSIVQGLEKLECAMGQGTGNADSSQWYLLNVQTNIQATDYEGLAYMGRPAAFTYIGDTVEIYPTPTSNWTLRVFYYVRPSQLCLDDFFYANVGASVVDITSLGGDQYDIEVDNIGLDGFSDPYVFDIQWLGGNQEMIAVSAPGVYSGVPQHITVTLSANQADLIDRDPSYGGTKTIIMMGAESPTPYIQLPEELANALVSYVGAVVLAEKGDSEKAQVFSQKAELAIKNIVDLAMPRSKGQPSVFKTRNTYLRRRLGRGYGSSGGFGF
jgi:hypothetical protein